MNKGRIIFWSMSGMVILVVGSAAAWYGTRPEVKRLSAIDTPEQTQAKIFAKNDRPPEAWPNPNPWWKRATIDSFDKQSAGKSWPQARRAVVAFVKHYSSDPTCTGDEIEDARQSSELASDFGCNDPLLQLIAAICNETPDRQQHADRIKTATFFASSAAAWQGSKYPASIKVIGLLRSAEMVGSMKFKSPKFDPAKATEYAEAAIALLPEALAEPDLPRGEVLRIGRYTHRASAVIHHKRLPYFEKFLAAAESAKVPKSTVLTAQGEFLTKAAWDARGSGFANSVTEDGWKLFAQRLDDARRCLTQAWDLDNTNNSAAEEMITVCMGQSAEGAEVDRWFGRALAARPDSQDACDRKMLLLQPKWGGSPAQLILFGRELARLADPRSATLSLNLVDAHWTIGTLMNSGSGYPSPEYFKDNPDAWTDISGVYEKYLARVPNSLIHRTRYAVLATWSEHWDVAAAQFKQLGKEPSPHVLPPTALAALQRQVEQRSKKSS